MTWDAARANTKENGPGQTTPVEQYAQEGAGPYGAVDMAGNVWEWCSTRWHNEQQKAYNYPYTPDDGREELRGGDDVWRVLRGGSWASEKKRARCAARLRIDPRPRRLLGLRQGIAVLRHVFSLFFRF
jgi:gamma-glutamyl hercynylcysteine S-oxide synthase